MEAPHQSNQYNHDDESDFQCLIEYFDYVGCVIDDTGYSWLIF